MFGILARRTAVVALLVLAGIGGGQTVRAQAPTESEDISTADLLRQMEERRVVEVADEAPESAPPESAGAEPEAAAEPLPGAGPEEATP